MKEPTDQMSRSAELPSLSEFARRTCALSERSAVTAVRADQRKRWENGDRVEVEKYLELLAQAPNPDFVLDLVYGEYLLRESLGEKPSPSAYGRRFPELKAALLRQIELQEALVENDEAIEPEPGESATHWTGPKRDAGAQGARERDPRPRLRIPGFELHEELGRGGMGVVYKAWQGSLKRFVAVKVLHPPGAVRGEALRRLRREAEAIAALRHPNIAWLHEYGEVDGDAYLVLEYVEGPTLGRLIAGRAAPARVAAEFVAVLADAVQYAHDRGIVHRDLKPENILLQKVAGSQQPAAGSSTDYWLLATAYSPKIADFGLAKFLGDGELSSRTATGQILGTPAYMAPEQAAGRSDLVRPCTDIHALGVVLYELLAGRPPFRSVDPIYTLALVREGEPLPIRQLQPGTPRDMETICLKCLAKEPSRRYASAAALAEDLRRFLRGESVLARPESTLARGWRWCRRRPVAAGLIAALFLVASVAYGALSAQLSESRRLLQLSMDQEALAVKRRQRDEANLARARATMERCDEAIRASKTLVGPEGEKLRTQLLNQVDKVSRALRDLQERDRP